jgi:hypothetical protein
MVIKNIIYRSRKFLCIGFFLCFYLQVFSQTAKVQGEYTPTPEEIREDNRKRKLEEEIRLKEKEVIKLMGKANLHYASATTFYLNDFDKKEKLQNIIKRNESLYSKANDAQFLSKCNQISSKYSQLGKKTGSPCSWLKKIRKISKENIKKAKIGIANIGKKKKKTASKINNIHKDINELDDALGNITNTSNQNKKVLKAYNTKNKEKSIDDFLKNNSKFNKKNKSNDFLSSSSTKKKNNDFLSGISKPPNFSDSDASKGYKIDYKNNTQGVVDIAGNILIPYKKWTIREYKNGIAKVDVKIDNYNNACSSKAYGSIYATASKTGFIDDSTNFIDGYKITFSGGFNNRYTGLVLQRGDDNRTAAEKKASKKRAAKRRRLARKECEAKLDEWKTGIINRYK